MYYIYVQGCLNYRCAVSNSNYTKVFIQMLHSSIRLKERKNCSKILINLVENCSSDPYTVLYLSPYAGTSIKDDILFNTQLFYAIILISRKTNLQLYFIVDLLLLIHVNN